MATVTVEINGRPYAVGCADGQEERVQELARQFDVNVMQVARDVGQVGDLRLFLMAALMLADELQEARLTSSEPAPETPPLPPPPPVNDAGIAEALNAVAARLERLTQSI